MRQNLSHQPILPASSRPWQPWLFILAVSLLGLAIWLSPWLTTDIQAAKSQQLSHGVINLSNTTTVAIELLRVVKKSGLESGQPNIQVPAVRQTSQTRHVTVSKEGYALLEHDRVGLFSNLPASKLRQLLPSQYLYKIRKLQGGKDANNPATAYLNAWQRRVESYATVYFSERAQCIQDSFVMMIILGHDGSLLLSELLSHPEHEFLAIESKDLLHRSGPFQSFPEDLHRYVDHLAFVREWKFKGTCSTLPDTNQIGV